MHGLQYWNTVKTPFVDQKQDPEKTARYVSTTMDFIPIVGDAKGLAEVFTGRDLVTGEDLGYWRYSGLLFLSEAKMFRGLGRPAQSSLNVGSLSNVLGGEKWDLIRNVNAVGGGENCVSCAIKVHEILSGQVRNLDDAVALSDELADKSLGLNILQDYFGKPTTHTKFSEIMEDLLSSGSGSHRVVVTRSSDTSVDGHAFNVVNDNGVIKIVDGQWGRSWSGSNMVDYLKNLPDFSNLYSYQK